MHIYIGPFHFIIIFKVMMLMRWKFFQLIELFSQLNSHRQNVISRTDSQTAVKPEYKHAMDLSIFSSENRRVFLPKAGR